MPASFPRRLRRQRQIREISRRGCDIHEWPSAADRVVERRRLAASLQHKETRIFLRGGEGGSPPHHTGHPVPGSKLIVPVPAGARWYLSFPRNRCACLLILPRSGPPFSGDRILGGSLEEPPKCPLVGVNPESRRAAAVRGAPSAGGRR